MAFRFNYQETMEQAKTLDELSREIEKSAAVQLEEICGNIDAAWNGDAGKAYLRYMRGVQTDLKKKADYLHTTADFLRSAAKKIQSAEETAKAAARRIQ